MHPRFTNALFKCQRYQLNAYIHYYITRAKNFCTVLLISVNFNLTRKRAGNAHAIVYGMNFTIIGTL